jgi:hypothetical protein
MRLLQYNNDGEFSLTQFFDDIPRYAILSHTWGPEEVTFRDMIEGNGTNKTDFNKIQFCAEQARRDGLHYFWVDTCCIDKSSSAELAAVRLLTQQVCVRNARSLHRSIEVLTLDDCTYMIPLWQPTASILPEAFYQMPYMFQI